ncbi:M13-type metalloendopeptidase [Propionimicrobium lymphophilum]|uniref:M13 family metallopeptidase n=1 Tax=Propionimicrobium lymphophilum TaxID=33012 RepID=UPI002551A4D7|nr:M13-type metalloendopeptidase [Propionimicrobium lymphophilum]MDK7710781.1 M13-type metalloendopeptidase [Propionimicrobium lymphophilum]MDK7734407.1 M13-type metalloendopeptidase [Propionimicrobium lymphophilum]
MSALQLDHIDNEVKASQDLFRHANGKWLDSAEIPEDKGGWGAFQKLSEDSEKAVKEIVTGITPDDDPTTERSKIANLYASFMDTDRIEAVGVEPIVELAKKADEITSISKLSGFLGYAARYDLGGLFGIGNDSDPGNPNRYLIFVGQGGIGLPDEEYYRLDEHGDTVANYRRHIERMFELVGYEDADEQADLVVDLETRIAAHHWDKVRTRDMVEMYHLQTWDEFTATCPAFDWDAFLKEAELPKEAVAEVVNCQRTFLPDVSELLTDVYLPAWRAWARWGVIDSLAGVGPQDLVEQNFEFYSKQLQGIPQLRERWKRGISLVESVLGEAIGKIYVAEHFPAATKARAQELVDNLIRAYHSSISKLDWMTEATRSEALDKLSKFHAKIGYPDKWRDYSALQISPDDLIGNVQASSSFEFDYMIEQLSKPVDPDEWMMYPQTVNAYYHPLRNEIVFPAAILQPPFFNAEADDAVNYGGIGAVIGHEIGHGFDDEGSTCDGDGRLRNWWSDEDRKAFEERTASLVAQYNELSPAAAPEVKVNGELTLGENIGDLGGLAIAYKAWQIACGGTEPEPIDGLTGAQRLFMSWAQVWCGKSRPERARQLIAIDPHSPAEIRCNQVVRNLDAFHEAFNVKPSDPMWLAPQQRVSIW